MLLSPPIENSSAATSQVIRLPTTDPEPASSGDDSDSSYVKVPASDPPCTHPSPGHRFPPQRFRTIERSPLTWNEIPASLPAVANHPHHPQHASTQIPTQIPHSAPSPPSSQDHQAATATSVAASLHTRAPSLHANATLRADPVSPPSAVTSLADVVPLLRRVNSDSPHNTGSPASHSSGGSTVIPPCKQSNPRTIRLPDPASPLPPPTPPLVIAIARESPSSTHLVSPGHSLNVPGTPLSYLLALHGLLLANCAAHELRPSGLQLSTLHPILHYLFSPTRNPLLRPCPPNPNPRIKPPPLRLCHPSTLSTSFISSP